MKYLVPLLFLILGALLLAGCASEGSATVKEAPAGCAACELGKSGETTWCDACGVGFVDGKKTKCKGCFAAKTGGPECESCK